MGTNYYFHSQPKCKECGRETEGIHIGKSSGGWCFSLHVMPEEKIINWQDWLDHFKNYKDSYIKDEYGDIISFEKMIDIVENRKWNASRQWTAKELFDNHAEPGPNGLVRHRVDGIHCVGHGDGTYDYITGEFS